MAKIMLVEDDNNLREIYEARLQAEGYTIVSAKDGEEALVMAKNEQPDLIISDVMMPKVSGFEMLDILRNTEGLKEVKVVMLTALGQSDDQKRADLLGADRYLVKSQVTLEDIVKVTHELLNDNLVVDTMPIDAELTPVAVEAMPMATPPTQELAFIPEVRMAQPVTEPVAETAPLPQTVSAQSTIDEQAAVPAYSENFVSSNTNEASSEAIIAPIAEVVSVEDDKVMAEAINNLIASTPASAAPVSEITMLSPAPNSMSPQVITPTQAVDGNVPIANKKVISPLNTEPVAAARPDLNELLAIENAKEQVLADAAEPAVPAFSPEPVNPFDPNSIAL